MMLIKPLIRVDATVTKGLFLVFKLIPEKGLKVRFSCSLKTNMVESINKEVESIFSHHWRCYFMVFLKKGNCPLFCPVST